MPTSYFDDLDLREESARGDGAFPEEWQLSDSVPQCCGTAGFAQQP